MIVHLTARLRPELHLLVDLANAWWLWRRLRETWPTALAAVLMDSHLHLVVRVTDAGAATSALGAVLGGHARHVGEPRLWLRVPDPTPLGSAKHVRRSVRYVHLNPVRAGLVEDPLEWPLSTHRGAVGAEYLPWVDAAELARELGRPVRSLPEWLHHYVSADAETNPAGTPMPIPVMPREPGAVPQPSLDRIIGATSSATPWSSVQERRHLVVLLARHQGVRSTAAIARAAGISERRVRSLSLEPNPRLLAAGALCLGDRRLVLPAQLQPPPASRRKR